MIVELKIKLDLGDKANGLSDRELRQIIFDNLLNLTQTSHSQWALRFLSKCNPNKAAYEHHREWADIIKKAQWDVTKL